MSIWKDIAVTSDENNVFCACHIWDIKTGNEINRIKQGATIPRCLAFIGENHVICGSKDPKVLNVWSLTKQMKMPFQIKCLAPIIALAISPNGSYCVGAISSQLYIWRVLTGQLIAIKNDHHNNVNCVKFDEMESYFVSGSEDALVIAWDMSNIINSAVSKTCETAMTKPLHVWNNHTLGVKDICVTNRGIYPRVISASRDKCCKIYNLHTGECVFTIYTCEELYSVALDPLGCFLYLGTGSGIIIKAPSNFIARQKSVDIQKDSENVLHEHQQTVSCLSVSTDGQCLLSGSNDGKAIIWNLSLRVPSKVLKHEGRITNAFFWPYPSSLDEFENKKKSPLLIKPFQFAPTSVDNEMLEVILPAHKPSKNVCSTSLLDSFFGEKNVASDSLLDSLFKEEEGFPQAQQAMEHQYSLYNKQNIKLYKETQTATLLHES